MATNHAEIARFERDLLPHIVDRLARLSPDAPYIEFPRNPRSYEDGFRTVTYRELANTVNGLAWWLETNLGPAQGSEVISYLGPNDLRYIALILAAAKTGYVLFLTSPRNSQAAHESLFDDLRCRTLLTPGPPPAPAQTILSGRVMKHHTVPSVPDLLDGVFPPYEFRKTYELNRWDPFFVLHTSGSTGIPKPLTWTHETCARVMNFLGRDPPDGEISLERMHQGKRCLNAFPPFHGACVVTHLLEAIPFGTVMIAPLPEVIPTAEGLVQALSWTNADFAFLVPSIIAELSHNESVLDAIAPKLDMIMYCGGDLPSGMGDKVASKVTLKCQFGASEIGLVSQLEPPDRDDLDWRYVHFHPCMGVEFEEVTEGVFELVVRRDPAKEDTQSTFTIGPVLRTLEYEYRSRDLFSRHPRNPNLWAWRARADDIIVFLNGEKTNPVSMEQFIVASNREVSSALVVGAQRFQAALVIESADNSRQLSTREEAMLIEKVWPSIQEANEKAPAHARIEKSLVLVAPVKKPMIRAGKGTIQRAATVAQYEEEIEALYANADLGWDEGEEDGTFEGTAASLDTDTVKLHLKLALLEMGASPPEESKDLFQSGFDSLQALQLTRQLRRRLGCGPIPLPTIYSNPTVDQLAQAIAHQQMNPDAPGKDDRMDLGRVLSEYQERIRKIQGPSHNGTPSKELRILLTGSTGTLGTYLLQKLVSSPGVGHVYCLNRRDDGSTVQDANFASAGFPPVTSYPVPVTFLQGDPAQPQLGLDITAFETLRAEVTLVMHNAWPVNFNYRLSAFRNQLDGVVNLLEFSTRSAGRARVFFVSSVSSVGALGSEPAPETTIDDVNAPFGNGYGMSKWLAEQLLAAGCQHLDIPVAFARVGQVAGPRGMGTWNRAEWMPSLAISSMLVGAFPESLGPSFDCIEWLPVEDVAAALSDLALSAEGAQPRGRGTPDVFHVANSSACDWKNLLDRCTSTASDLLGRSIDVVSAKKWIDLVETHVTRPLDGLSTPSDLRQVAELNPAARILPFFKSIMLTDHMNLRLETHRTRVICSRLQNTGPISADEMEHWMQGWVAATPLLKKTRPSS